MEFKQNEINKIYCGDSLEVLKTFPDDSIDCCISSPPYWGLRDYGIGGQIGLEKTPEEYVNNIVNIYREIKRVLKKEGTCWLNLGDSYYNYRPGKGQRVTPNSIASQKAAEMDICPRRGNIIEGLKEKDLVGIPWRVAFALQQPYYTGKIKDEKDRVWLAAMVDAEGSICGSEYQNNGRTKTNIYISITNTSMPIIDKCERLFPQEIKHIYEKKNENSSRICYRWDVEKMEQKSLFIREIYPHLVAKRKQAILGYNFLEMQKGIISKKKGYLIEQQEKRSWLINALSELNNGKDVKLPSWMIEPPSLLEEGFYLRQDIIWAKNNPMPESVTDRCTKSHEYVFLLTKSPKYYFDNVAIKEPTVTRNKTNRDRDSTRLNNTPGRTKMSGLKTNDYETRNKRDVWNINTKPFREAHFATFPEALVEPMIKAGCPEFICNKCGKILEKKYERVDSEIQRPRKFGHNGNNDRNDTGDIYKEKISKFIGYNECNCDAGFSGGIVLDPFMGSGTTGVVAKKLGRNYIGIELSPAYITIAEKRLAETTKQLSLI